MYAAIGLLIGVLVIVGLVPGSLAWSGVGAGLLIGIAIGVLLTRTSNIMGDTDAGAIVTNLGWIGGVIRFAYLVSVFFKDSIVGAVFSHSCGKFIHSACLSRTVGVVAARVASSRRAILPLVEAINLNGRSHLSPVTAEPGSRRARD